MLAGSTRRHSSYVCIDRLKYKHLREDDCVRLPTLDQKLHHLHSHHFELTFYGALNYYLMRHLKRGQDRRDLQMVFIVVGDARNYLKQLFSCAAVGCDCSLQPAVTRLQTY